MNVMWAVNSTKTKRDVILRDTHYMDYISFHAGAMKPEQMLVKTSEA